MRRVRVSRTFVDQLNALLEQGFPRFGARVVTEKRERVFGFITGHLAYFPKTPADPELGLCLYTVAKTPFKLVYDFDDDELRVHFVFHASASLVDLDPRSAEW